MFAAVVAPLLGGLFKVIDQAVEDKDQANKIKSDVQRLMLEGRAKKLEAAAKIIVAEARGNWLQRSWRPTLMMVFCLIIFNNYIVVPYAIAFGVENLPVLDLPGGFWALLTTGVGGYIAGRSGEKIMQKFKES